MMNKKPIRYRIPRIHNIKYYWYIQWLDKEFYIKKGVLKKYLSFNSYDVLETFLFILILIIAEILPYKDIYDFLRGFLLAIIIGFMNGIFMAEHENKKELE